MDNTSGSHQRYTIVAIALQWTIALLIFFNLSLGFFMEGFEPQLRGIVVPLHISSGLSVLILTAIRVAWRLTHPPPPLADGLKRWERTAAHVVHRLICPDGAQASDRLADHLCTSAPSGRWSQVLAAGWRAADPADCSFGGHCAKSGPCFLRRFAFDRCMAVRRIAVTPRRRGAHTPVPRSPARARTDGLGVAAALRDITSNRRSANGNANRRYQLGALLARIEMRSSPCDIE